MTSALAHAAFGAAVALLTAWGHHANPYAVALLGALGGWCGDSLGRRARVYLPGLFTSYLLSAIGAMVLTLVYAVVVTAPASTPPRSSSPESPASPACSVTPALNSSASPSRIRVHTR